MRVDIHSAWDSGERSYRVSYSINNGAVVLSPRFLSRQQTASGAVFPQPPPEEVAGFPNLPNDRDEDTESDKIWRLVRRLCTTATGDQIERAADHILKGLNIEAFGRYLFSCLLGKTHWSAIRAAGVGEEIVELALSWDARSAELAHLPWEMIHGPEQQFVAEDLGPAFTFTRLVPDAQYSKRNIQAPLRVLFVVGTKAKDPAILPGAEFLGVMRRLGALGLNLTPRILLEADPDRLQDTIQSFRPSVVHFICHGAVVGGTCQLYLRDLERKDRAFPCDARELINLLRLPDGGLPAAVILNACEAGSSASHRLSAPLAAALVSEGVAVAVGMAGRVSDLSCRLFSRRFYEAIVRQEPLAVVAAQARRAGLTNGVNPRASMDWALPTFYVAPNAPAVLPIEGPDWTQSLAQIAIEYNPAPAPPVFCGRMDVLDGYAELMSSGPTDALRVLALEAPRGPSGEENEDKYGKTRALREIAAQAVCDGHIPCLVHFENKVWPTRPVEVALAIFSATLDARKHFRLKEQPASQLLELITNQIGEPSRFSRGTMQALTPSAYRSRIRRDLPMSLKGISDPVLNLDPRDLGDALREDLAALVKEAHSREGAPPGLRVLVLLDDVDQFGDGAIHLRSMLDRHGLGTAEDPVPLVIAFGADFSPGFNSSLGFKSIATVLKSLATEAHYARHILLSVFEAEEDRVAYQQFLLLDPTEALTVKPAPSIPMEVREKEFFQRFGRHIRGVPSKLACLETKELIEVLKRFDWLEVAHDERIIQQMEEARP